MESNSTIVQDNNNEKIFYEKVDERINLLSKNFREKCAIKQQVYTDILKCLLLAKGTSGGPYSATFVYWARQKFIVVKIAGIDFVADAKLKKPVCVYEAFYNVINEAHTTVSHGGREKTSFELNSQYSWIPRFCIEIFLKQCVPCQTRKPLKYQLPSKPIISLGVMTRLQIDLIDMRTRPDKISADIVYCWILNCIDHFSKFSWAFPLKNKSANEVAVKLRELLFVFGPPRLLHSDNGREFVANVIMELKSLFPDLHFIRGRPRHPQSQGCIERANGVLCDALGKWMCNNNSSSWSYGLLPVVYGINTRKSTVTKTTPYEVMFGQPPRCDSEYWRLVCQSEINDEDSLPTPVAESEDDLNGGKDYGSINSDEDIDTEVASLVDQLSDDVVSYSLINTPSITHSSSIIATTSEKHDIIRKTATNHYLATANKKMKLHQDGLKSMGNKYNLNDCVGISIHSVDRTNTDPKYLPCLVVDKFEKNNIFLYKLICQYGALENTFEVGQLVDLKAACPDELKHIDADNLMPITIIEASKLYSRGSTTGHTCNCRGKCATKTCPCKKENVFCSTKCHSKRGGCSNMD
jgi:transposase InsO family protein